MEVDVAAMVLKVAEVAVEVHGPAAKRKEPFVVDS